MYIIYMCAYIYIFLKETQTILLEGSMIPVTSYKLKPPIIVIFFLHIAGGTGPCCSLLLVLLHMVSWIPIFHITHHKAGL